VKDGRKEKADAGLLDAASDALGSEVDLHAELLEDVGRSALRRGGTVAVLGHARAARRGNDRGQGRDVEG